MKYVEKCQNADKYKAQRKSSCGCFVCNTLWRLNQLEREVLELRQSISTSNNSSVSARQSSDAALYVANLSR